MPLALAAELAELQGELRAEPEESRLAVEPAEAEAAAELERVAVLCGEGLPCRLALPLALLPADWEAGALGEPVAPGEAEERAEALL